MANPDGPWVRFFASDWLAGTRGMTAAETGVYITLIALMYERDDGQIERDDRRLARMCGLKQHMFAAMLDDLIDAGKIIVSGSKLGNDRATYESQNRADRATKARRAALAKAEQNQRPKSARAPSKQSVSSAPTVPRARASEPEPDKERNSNEFQKKADTSKRGTRLDAGWRLPGGWGQWALTEFPHVDADRIRREADSFRDFWISKTGANATKLDWEATWRNWCRKAFSRSPPAASHQRKPTAHDYAAELLREMENADSQTPDENHSRLAGGLPAPVVR